MTETPGKYVLDCNGESGDTELEERMLCLFEEVYTLWQKKQLSYGPGNIAAGGERGCWLRANDKMARLKRLVWDRFPDPLTDEKVEDTWKDLVNYGLMAILCHRGQWPKE